MSEKTLLRNIEELEMMICACHSFEHQLKFWKDDTLELHCEAHLKTHRNFFKRLIYGVRYIFGYKSKYGAWDSFIFTDANMIILRSFLVNQAKEE